MFRYRSCFKVIAAAWNQQAPRAISEIFSVVSAWDFEDNSVKLESDRYVRIEGLMNTLTIAIPDESRAFIDREIAAGHFKDSDSLVQAALKELMRVQWKERIERKIDESLDEIERGEVTPWHPGDFGRMGREYLAEKRAIGKQP